MPNLSKFLGLTTDEWQAVGSIATAAAFLIAAIAVIVAFLQLRHARGAANAQLAQQRELADEQLRQNQKAAAQQIEQSRTAAAEQLAQDRAAMYEQRKQAMDAALDQSRPYVLVSIELSPISFNLLDLVIENAGAGPAYDVTIQVDPPLRRAREVEGHEIANARIFREPLPMLPPRYRLRTHFDSAIERHGIKDDSLPDAHNVTVEYHDGKGHRWQETATLDMNIAEGLLFTTEYGLHDAAKALREIRDLLKKSKTLESPLAVTVEDRDKYVERVRTEQEERRRQHELLVEKMRPRQSGAVPEEA